MKVEFYVDKADVRSIRRIYARECRNFQFDVPCSLSIESYGLDGGEILVAVEKALEHIAWLPFTLKEIKVENFDVATNVAKVTIGEFKND